MQTMIVRSILVTSGAVLALAGCGDDGPTEYTAESICGVPSALVADVLGTPEFEVDTDDRTTMPLDGSAPLDNLDGYESSSTCSMVSADGQLSLLGEIFGIGPSEAEILQESLRTSTTYDTFDHAGGVGGVKAPQAQWVCGEIRVLVQASGDVEPSAASLEAVTKAFADVTGCWSGESA